jgi:hypothetical protein
MSRKCLNHPHNFCYVCDDLTKYQRRNCIPLVEKCYELCFGCKRVIKIKLGPSYLLWNVYGASHGMGKWFALNAILHSRGLQGTKRPLIRLYFCRTNKAGITSKSSHTVKYLDLSRAKRSVPHTQKLSAPNPPEYLTFSDDSSDSDKDHVGQEGGNVECARNWSKLFLIWPPFIKTRTSWRPSPWFKFV